MRELIEDSPTSFGSIRISRVQNGVRPGNSVVLSSDKLGEIEVAVER